MMPGFTQEAARISESYFTSIKLKTQPMENNIVILPYSELIK
jgi:hypothetical protein